MSIGLSRVLDYFLRQFEYGLATPGLLADENVKSVNNTMSVNNTIRDTLKAFDDFKNKPKIV